MENLKYEDLEFIYYESDSDYETKYKIDDSEVNIVLKSYNNDYENIIKKAYEFLKNFNLEDIKSLIVKECYLADKKELESVHNREISEELYRKLLKLTTIAFGDKFIDIWFDDSNLYGGHSFNLSKKYEDDVYNIDLAG